MSSWTLRLLSVLPGVQDLVAQNEALEEKLAEAQSRYRLVGAERDEARQRLKALKQEVVTPPAGSLTSRQRDPWYFICHKLQAAYLQMPKAACSSIQAFILSIEKPQLYAELKSSLSESAAPLHHSPDNFETGAAPDGYFRFTFVRHPFDRIVSFYRNQIAPVQRGDEGDSTRLSAEAAASGFELHMAFPDFLDQIIEDGKARENIHVRPQSDLIFNRQGLTVDYIGKVEEMHRHLPILDRALGGPGITLGNLNRSGAKTWHSNPAFTRAVVDRLRERYWFDLNFLGYSANLP